MAGRDAVTITSLSLSALNAKPALTAFTPANGLKINLEGNSDDFLLILDVAASGSSAGVATIKAGANPPAFRAGLGDLALTASGSAAMTEYYVPVESARFLQSASSGSAGYILVDFDSGVASGSVAAIRLPKGL